MNWQCPFCNAHQTLTSASYQQTETHLKHSDPDWPNKVGTVQFFIKCSNLECCKITVTYAIRPLIFISGRGMDIDYNSDAIIHMNVIPESMAKPQPDCIPAALREDYREACLIRKLSPKASATLSRRCLQGMIRNFCSIALGTLDQEIRALRKALDDGNAPAGVTVESVDAIDHVRRVGNIGAHMEKNIDHIVPVDPGEAQVLIDLVESLFEEWYVARDRRQKRFAAVAAVATEKVKAIADFKTQDTIPLLPPA